MQMKFIIFQDKVGLKPVIFPKDIIHAEIADICSGTIVSAGFVDIATKEFWGESSSLKISSRSEETPPLQRIFWQQFFNIKR